MPRSDESLIAMASRPPLAEIPSLTRAYGRYAQHNEHFPVAKADRSRPVPLALGKRTMEAIPASVGFDAAFEPLDGLLGRDDGGDSRVVGSEGPS